MSADLLAALCLVMVIEGLVLFVGPGAWKRLAEQIHGVPDAVLRRFGLGLIAVGLLCLQLVR
ncbi:MAG: DUF2065 family protein [Lysobacteraceae bacterium]